ncbi:MAG: HEAT repeat domain-containing protein, partial [Planctomycetota bacterium]
ELTSGKVSTPEPEVLIDMIRRGSLSDQDLALGVASRLKPRGLREVAEKLFESDADFEDAKIVRFRAAMTLLALGESDRARGTFEEALAPDAPKRLKTLAIRFLKKALTLDDATPLLQAAMSSEDSTVWAAAQDGFASFGRESVPTLIAMMRDKSQNANYRGGAAHTLSRIRAKSSVSALLEAAADDNEYVANAAINAAIRIGSLAVAPQLAKLLEKGSTQDTRIVSYFQTWPASEAVKGLEIFLKRSKNEFYNSMATVTLEWIRAVEKKGLSSTIPSGNYLEKISHLAFGAKSPEDKRVMLKLQKSLARHPGNDDVRKVTQRLREFYRLGRNQSARLELKDALGVSPEKVPEDVKKALKVWVNRKRSRQPKS